jgi:C-terminal processing protease CtpA/Prc
VASLQSLIEQKYFNEAAIPRINSSLAGALAGGDLSQSKDLNELAARLTSVLYESTHDKHLFVSVSAPSVHGGGTPQMTRAEAARLSNYGMKAAKVLEGNVGYLEVTSFYRRDEGAETIDAAMRFLARTDALILDFRNNGGGSPETAVQLLSYFFAEPNLTLFAIVPRSGETEVERTVQAGVAYRDESRPLYILVSAHTWSAGEGVPFLLQERSRAKVIGETTAGAANPAAPYHINPALSVTIPFGRIESAVKKTNWEGVGVAPDTVVSPDKAFQEAYVQALEEILARTSDSSKRQALSSALVNARK